VTELYQIVTAVGGFFAAAAMGMVIQRIGRIDAKIDRLFELRDEDLHERGRMQVEIAEMQVEMRVTKPNGRARA
jgi:hypothetical protein